MKENWEKRKGMPPHYVEVLDRKNQGNEEIIFAEGELPHLGLLHKGWKGDETIIFRRKTADGDWKIIRKELQDYKKAADPNYTGKKF